MEELKEYDRAAQNFMLKIKPKSYPLNCWDFFPSYYDAYCKSMADVAALSTLSKKLSWKLQIDFAEHIFTKKHVLVVTDKALKILYTTENSFQLSGYLPKEVIGKSPKIFQGKKTCPVKSAEISHAVQKGICFETVLVNYRKDGTPYNCWIKGQPIKNKNGDIVNFIAYEKEVA